MAGVHLVPPVLDVGCGDGHFASIAFNEPLDVGLDPMPRDLAEAARLRPAVFRHLVLADGGSMPFPDETFGTVISNSVLEHIPDIDSTLMEISRVLRTGGTLAVTMPNERYPELLLGSTVLRRAKLHRLSSRYGDFFNQISHHYHVDSVDVWIRRMDRAGLTVVEHRIYFSARAHRAFDAAHVLGLPHLLTKRLFGRWVIHPIQQKPFAWWYRRYFDEPLPDVGAYQFLRFIKR
jgi:SAM-dependent methyltransferase